MDYISKDLDRLYDKFKIILNKNSNENYIETSNDLIENNILNIFGYKKVHFDKFINWEDEKMGRSYLRRLNGHEFLGDLIEAYRETKEEKYLSVGLELVYQWIDKYENEYDIEYRNKYDYHDETTALRMNYWLNFILNCYNLFRREYLERFVSNISKTAELLSNENFHNKNTNHGMYQDLSLLLYSQIFNLDSKSKIYEELSKNRLKKYFDFVFVEGVHKEHTPFYHYEVSKSLKLYSIVMRSIDNDFSKYLYEKYENTLRFSYQILKPNGCFPEIGDNASKKVIESYKDLYNDKYFDYAITSGNDGVIPKEDSVVFKDAGYAIFRDSWGKGKNGLYILFSAAYNSNYHKHCDDLSVLIYKGKNIFVESGFNGYEYKDKFTKYAYSSFAHNTLIVDNKSIKLREFLNRENKTNNMAQFEDTSSIYDDVYIEDYIIREDKNMVLGVNNRYKDLIHKRKLEYDRINSKVEIKDYIISKYEHTYKILWNLDKSIKVKYDDGIYLYDDERIICKICINSSKNLNINEYIGDEENMRGWYFDSPRNTQKRITLEVEIKSTSVEVDTIIIFY
ncbi:heparinase II/III domain-containing protein [Romboutsia sp. 1001713B170207_170306_H8]|uniref:heparinase II/III domain-containing protein n=1 Tax=Romboutsia sp. 1001713B170207_170306_H8 TaxID=2787112 RepID=UPI0008232F8E|nr:heparinase II/III family protein [Romboutsia sp. 1001713B170207_170306_H8]SCI26789.1 Uncharacterized protein conserved in bacteria [uncultured Clostridium sp.]